MNSLLFAHTLYREDLLERVMSSTSIVFFCALELKPVEGGKYASCLSPSDVAGAGIVLPTTSTGALSVEDGYEDDDKKTTAERAVLRSLRGYMKALKERRLLAVSSIDGIIDFWKQILSVSGNTPSNSERSLQRFVDEDHDFDPYSFKRKTITILMRYLPAMWSHEAVSSLPPSTVRNLLDLMQVAIKTLLDCKLFPLQSAVSERDRLKPSSDAVEATSSAFSYAAARASARASRRAVGGSEAAFNAFRVQETVVATLTDMGFLDEDVRRMAAAHRTNSISTLTTHLLEMSSSASLSGTGIPAAAAVTGDTAVPVIDDSVAVTASATAASTATDPDPASVPNPASASIDAEFDGGIKEVLPVSLIAPIDATPQPIIAGGYNTDTQSSSGSSSSSSIPAITVQQPCELVLTVLKPLPLIPRRPTENLQKSKTFLHQILRKTLSMVPLSCLRLIERGVVKARGEWGIEVSSVNQVTKNSMTRYFCVLFFVFFMRYFYEHIAANCWISVPSPIFILILIIIIILHFIIHTGCDERSNNCHGIKSNDEMP